VYGKTFEECRTKLEAVQKRLAEDLPATDAKDTIANWSRHWRETTLAASDYKKQTKSQYAQLARVHVEGSPLLANLKLRNLKASHVEGWLVELRKKSPTNARDKSRRLSDSTIRTCYTVLRAQMNIAVRDGMLARNPVEAVKRPKVPKKKTNTVKVDAETIAKIIDLTTVSRYHHAIVLTSLLGTRIGETLGLRWRDVDEKNRIIRITKTTAGQGADIGLEDVKTERSHRCIPLTDAISAVLKAQRKMTVESQLKAGDKWSKQGDGLVFRTELGTIVDDRYVLRAVKSAARRAGVDGVTNHTLRHTAAQTWLEAGVHIKAVADLLGHASIAITGDIYGHTSDDTARKAMDALAQRLGHKKPNLSVVKDTDGGDTPVASS
jgi:integrase